MERTGVIKNRDFKNCDSRIYFKNFRTTRDFYPNLSVRLNAEQTANNKILRVQEKMQRDVDAAEKSESEAHQKYTEAKQKVNDLSEELMAEKHKLNLTAAELNQKEDRLDKLLSERYIYISLNKDLYNSK